MRLQIVTLCLSVFIEAPLFAQQLSVQELWSTKGTEEVGYLAAITGMAEAADGSIWISESLGINRVVALRPDGSFSVVARNGDGPGEVRSPSFITRTFDGGLAIFDFHHGIEVFDSSGNFVRRLPPPFSIKNPKGLAALPNGDFVISGGARDYEFANHVIDGRTGRLIRSWHRIPRTDDPLAGVMVAGGPVFGLPDGSVLFSQAGPHRIAIFEVDNGNERIVAEDPELLAPIGDDFITRSRRDGKLVTSFRWYFPQSCAVFQLDDRRILNVVFLKDANESVWEIYGTGGQLRSRITVDKAYRAWGLTRDGDVLASYTDPETGEYRAVRLELGFSGATHPQSRASPPHPERFGNVR